MMQAMQNLAVLDINHSGALVHAMQVHGPCWRTTFEISIVCSLGSVVDNATQTIITHYGL